MEEFLKLFLGEYGLAGAVIIGLAFAIFRFSKRQTELEDRQIELESERYRQMIELIKDMNSVVQSNTEFMKLNLEYLRSITKQSSGPQSE